MAVKKGNIKQASFVDMEWHAGKVTIDNVTKNYSASVAYYQGKEEAFKQFWSSQLVNTKNQIIDDFLNKAAERTAEDYNYIVSKWASIYDSFPKNMPSVQKEQNTKTIFISTVKNDAKIQNIMNISKELRDWVNGKNKERSIYNILGYMTEDNLKSNLQAMVASNYNALMKVMTTGKMQGKSMVTTGKKNVRADNLIYPSSLSIDWKDGSLIDQKTKEILHLEAQTQFSFEEVAKYGLTQEDILESFEDYLNGDFAGAGGIVIKTYSLKRLEDQNFLKFSESKPLQDNLNDLLANANYKKGWLTQDFVDMYIIYHLSKFIPFIVSPISIGFVSKGGFMWMSDFLDKYRFYMKNKRGAKEGGKVNGKTISKGKTLSDRWFRYSIPSPVIQIYNKNRQKAQFIKRINSNRYRYVQGEVTSILS